MRASLKAWWSERGVANDPVEDAGPEGVRDPRTMPDDPLLAHGFAGQLAAAPSHLIEGVFASYRPPTSTSTRPAPQNRPSCSPAPYFTNLKKNLTPRPVPISATTSGARHLAETQPSGPQFKRLIDGLAREEVRKELRESPGIEPLAASEDVRDRPPAEPDVVLLLVIEALTVIHTGTVDDESDDKDNLVLEAPRVTVPKRGCPAPGRCPDLLGADVNTRLLPQFAHRGLDVRLALVDAPAGKFPPISKFRHRQVVSPEEQYVAAQVLHDEPHRVALDDG